MRSPSLSLSIAFFAQHVHGQFDTCYLANGDPLPNDPTWYDMFRPCTFGGPASTCCALNRAVPPGSDPALGSVQDECLPNGLCQQRYLKNGNETIEFYTNFCADPNFTGPNCLSICTPRNSAGNAALTACSGKADSEEWCCGANNVGCCTSGNGRFTLPQKFRGAISSSVVGSSQSTSSATSSATSSPSTSPSPSATTLPPAEGNTSNLSSGAIAGIVIGALAGLALLGTIFFFAMRRNKHRKSAAATFHPSLQYEKYTQHDVYRHDPPVELEQPPLRVVELPAKSQ